MWRDILCELESKNGGNVMLLELECECKRPSHWYEFRIVMVDFPGFEGGADRELTIASD